MTAATGGTAVQARHRRPLPEMSTGVAQSEYSHVMPIPGSGRHT